MTLPNFLIIGQMKAGTSSLHAYLRDHPQVFMPALKEAKFFNTRIDDPGRAQWKQKGLPVTFAEYERLFDPVTHQSAIGEASPQYLQSEHAPPQIKRYLPDVRLIVSLRRPSERLYSLHLMLQRIGREPRDFPTAFREGKGERWLAENSTYDALRRYYDLFDRSRIESIRFDDLVGRTDATIERLHQFLGVDPQFKVASVVAHNEGGVWRNRTFGQIATHITTNVALMSNLKRVLPARVWAYAKHTHRRNIVKASPLTPQMRHEVSAHFREDTLKVQDLVGLDLSDWLVE